VDDEPDIRVSIKQAVEGEGFETKAANNGKQALEILRKEKFDLVLMDIFMPEMSGRDAVEAMRKDAKLKNQKVAFLTVVNLSEQGQSIVKKLKPVDYFQKPIDLDDFGKRLKKLLK
jgi:CheY-like chemotaxis protein